MHLLGVPRQMAGWAFRSKSSPLVPRGCGLSTAIPHACMQLIISNSHNQRTVDREAGINFLKTAADYLFQLLPSGFRLN